MSDKVSTNLRAKKVGKDWSELNDFIYLLEEKPFDPKPSRRPDDDEKRIIVSDIHGNYRNLYQLLLEVGAIRSDGSRVPGYWVAQIGDLIHGGGDIWKADQDATLLGAEWVDCQIIGNHDLAHISRKRFNSSFSQQHEKLDSKTTRRIQDKVGSGHYRTSIDVDGWFVSHAGIDPRFFGATPELENIDPNNPEDLRELSERLEKSFEEILLGRAEGNPLFTWTGGERGGKHPMGSLYWEDINELIEGYKARPEMEDFKQIVGHTPIKEPRRIGSVWATDSVMNKSGEGNILALTKDRGDEDWEPTVLTREERPDTLSFSDQISLVEAQVFETRRDSLYGSG